MTGTDGNFSFEKKTQGNRKIDAGKDVYTLALERIRYVYDLFDTITVSFSGGKDSTVVLNLALQVAHEKGKLPLHVFHFDEEAIPYEVEHYVRRVYNRPDVDLQWWCCPVKHTNACSGENGSWVTWNPDEREKWVRPMPPEGLYNYPLYHPGVTGEYLSIPEIMAGQFDPATYGRVGIMMGIRADESLTRRQAVSRRREENYIVQEWAKGDDFGGTKLGMGNTYKIYPIYDWKTADVWTAPSMFGWDVCAAYDLMEMAGIPHHSQRVAPPFGTQPMRSLWMFKQCFPDIWQKLQSRVPGANTGAMYARTALYAEGTVEKPSHLTWPEYIAQLLAEVPDEKMRRFITDIVRKNTITHMKKTENAPILPYVPHPDSGLTWETIAKIIIRRDNKQRTRPDMKMTSPRDPAAFRKAMEKWEAARVEYELELAGLDKDYDPNRL